MRPTRLRRNGGVEDMEQPNEPLAHKLRNAAIDRTTTDAERVDSFVIDEDGVLDLRVLDRDSGRSSIADPARALATIRGQLGDAHEVSDLYDESEPQRSLWRRGRTPQASDDQVAPKVAPKLDTTVAVPKTLPPLSRLSMVPVEGEPAPTDHEAQIEEEIEAGPEVDLRDESRPTADCPKCMGLGRRDLFDRFSQVEFYSCDNCLHMWQQDLG